MDLFSRDTHAAFIKAYSDRMAASGAKAAFDAAPTLENAEALTMAMYETIHEVARKRPR